MNLSPFPKVIVLAAASLCVGLPALRAQSFNYANFSSVAGLRLNGNAASMGGVLRLAPAQSTTVGSAFLSAPVALSASTSFHTQFQFSIGGGSNPGANGMTFCVQGIGATALGIGGADLGFTGIGSSFAVAFDELGANHSRGVNVLRANSVFVTGTNAFGNLQNQTLTAWIDYTAAETSLEIYLSAGSIKPATPLLTTNAINLFATVGSNAYFGFTGASGGFTNNHDVLNWSLSVQSVPEPGSIAGVRGA